MTTAAGLAKKVYQKLLKEIGELYETTRGRHLLDENRSMLRSNWEIGRLIIEAEGSGASGKKHGSRLIERLSEDLGKRYGNGFSERNLRYMRRFGDEYEMGEISDDLAWTHYRLLLTVRDDETRQALEKRAISEKLGRTKLELLIKKERELAGKRDGALDFEGKWPRLRRPKGAFNVYKVSAGAFTNGSARCFKVDCGFSVHREVRVAGVMRPRPGDVVESFRRGSGYGFRRRKDGKDSLYCYAAEVERVVDGDTLVAEVDVGFGTYVRQRLRLRGVWAAEVGTSEGEEAKLFAQKRLEPERAIAIKTYGTDRYGRYLADVLYGTDLEQGGGDLLENGVFFNQEILEAGLASVKPDLTWE